MDSFEFGTRTENRLGKREEMPAGTSRICSFENRQRIVLRIIVGRSLMPLRSLFTHRSLLREFQISLSTNLHRIYLIGRLLARLIEIMAIIAPLVARKNVALA